MVSRSSEPNSPTDPATTRSCPNSVVISSASRRTGTRTPSVLATRHSASSRTSAPGAIACSPKATGTASTIDTRKAVPASRKVGPRNRSGRTSWPARKSRKPRPSRYSTSAAPSARTRPSTCGPTTIPTSTSRTTGGTSRRGTSRAMSGATKAATATTSSPPYWIVT